ncbi:MAG: site-specific integrase [Motiliproteus sp.]
MARKLYSVRGDNWVGEYPADLTLGWQRNRRGIRRTLCKISDLEGFDDAEKARRLTDLYHIKQAALRNAQSKQEASHAADRRQKRASTMHQASKLWLEEVEVTNSAATRQTYAKTLSYYLEGVGDHKLRDFDRSHNIKFLKYLGTVVYQGRPMAESTKNCHIRQLGVFLRWAHDHEIIDRVWSLKKPKVPKKDMETYSIEELTRLREHILDQVAHAQADDDERQTRHMRNMYRAFMLATLSLLRLGPIWALRLDSIDLDKRLIRIQDNIELGWVNKKNKWPLKPINNKLAEFLKEDLAARDPSEVYYLDNGRGFPWYADRSAISKLAGKMCSECDLPKLKPFHWGMRATMITALLQQGVDPIQVQQLADHDDLSTTMLYKDSRRISQKGAADALGQLL